MGAWGRRVLHRELEKINPRLAAVGLLTVMVGLLNWLVVNERVVLYLLYLPIVLGAWVMSRRDSMAVAILAALMVVAYVFFLPAHLSGKRSGLLLWAELACWGGILVVTAYLIATLKGRMEAAMARLQRAYHGVLAILSRFIQTVDADTQAHCVRVAGCAVQIAREMRLGHDRVEEVRVAALLHDVGKVEVSVELLRKSAALSREEREHIRQHADRGAEIVKPIGGMLSHIADAIEAHHEKYDGTGYKGLQAEEIPLAARIIAVADVFDALISDRPYRKGMTVMQTMDHLMDGAGTHFDPAVVAALQRLLARKGEEGALCAESGLSM